MINLTDWNRIIYAAWAPVYDLLVMTLEGKRKKSLDVARIEPDEDVLLLGAGTGLDLNYLPKDASVTAVDITPGMIKRLKKRANTLGMQVDAKVMDGQSLIFPDESFDVVILHFVLAVIPDRTKAIKEAARVLRPGGRAIILNKFTKDKSEPSVALRLTNQVARLVITDITCQLAPIVAASGMKQVYEEEIGLGGFFKIAVLRKETTSLTGSTATEPAPVAAENVSTGTNQLLSGLTFATSATD